jgi:multiple sugar transport system substrate-binding protein
MQHDARLLRDDGDYGDFRAAAFRTGFAFYVDLFRRGFASPSGAAQVANLYRDFAEERFVFYIGGPWIIGELARRVPELAGRWATAPLPSPDAGRPGVSIAGGASLALVRTARDPAAAWRLIEYLAAPTQQIAFFRLTGDLPARRSAWTDGALGADAAVAAFARQLERVRATPKVPEWERIATKIGEHAEAVVRGHRDIDTALAALDADVDAILEKRRWMRRERARHVAGGAVR